MTTLTVTAGGDVTAVPDSCGSDVDVWTVPVAALRNLADPVTDWPWDSTPPTGEVTLAALSGLVPLSRPLTDDELRGDDPLPHLARIAHFVRHGWHDPVEVDVGCFGWTPGWPLLDGNHRVFAAAVRGDATIQVCVGGDVDLAVDLLDPVTVPGWV